MLAETQTGRVDPHTSQTHQQSFGNAGREQRAGCLQQSRNAVAHFGASETSPIPAALLTLPVSHLHVQLTAMLPRVYQLSRLPGSSLTTAYGSLTAACMQLVRCLVTTPPAGAAADAAATLSPTVAPAVPTECPLPPFAPRLHEQQAGDAKVPPGPAAQMLTKYRSARRLSQKLAGTCFPSLRHCGIAVPQAVPITIQQRLTWQPVWLEPLTFTGPSSEACLL